jgi:hypothetical protein
LILDLSKNTISSIPSEIGKLKALRRLNLWGNELSRLPQEIQSLTALEILNLRSMVFDEEEAKKLRKYLPNTVIYFPARCNCGP